MRPRSRTVTVALLATLFLATACSSLKFTRTTETSGNFKATGWAFTIFTVDLPMGAMQIARQNASDAGLANMQITTSRVVPDWGWFNWVLDVISVRKAVLRGTWGFSGDRARAEAANR